jgi:hypothetical protein
LYLGNQFDASSEEVSAALESGPVPEIDQLNSKLEQYLKTQKLG